jgi:hypothetical protein
MDRFDEEVKRVLLAFDHNSSLRATVAAWGRALVAARDTRIRELTEALLYVHPMPPNHAPRSVIPCLACAALSKAEPAPCPNCKALEERPAWNNPEYHKLFEQAHKLADAVKAYRCATSNVMPSPPSREDRSRAAFSRMMLALVPFEDCAKELPK